MIKDKLGLIFLAALHLTVNILKKFFAFRVAYIGVIVCN